MPQLITGDAFPALRAQSVNHGEITLPDDIPGDRFSVIMAYRADW